MSMPEGYLVPAAFAGEYAQGLSCSSILAGKYTRGLGLSNPEWSIYVQIFSQKSPQTTNHKTLVFCHDNQIT